MHAFSGLYELARMEEKYMVRNEIIDHIYEVCEDDYDIRQIRLEYSRLCGVADALEYIQFIMRGSDSLTPGLADARSAIRRAKEYVQESRDTYAIALDGLYGKTGKVNLAKVDLDNLKREMERI